jgi:RNA polymerase sigma-70 factor, ECF subfamily
VVIHNHAQPHITGVRSARRWREPFDLVEADAIAISGGQEIDRELQELRHGLEQLPDDRREILLLAHYHGRSYAEISHMLKIPVGTLRSRLTRARALLRRAVEGPNGEAMQSTGV